MPRLPFQMTKSWVLHCSICLHAAAIIVICWFVFHFIHIEFPAFTTFFMLYKICMLFYSCLFRDKTIVLKKSVGCWKIPLECLCMSVEWMFYIFVSLLLFSFSWLPTNRRKKLTPFSKWQSLKYFIFTSIWCI